MILEVIFLPIVDVKLEHKPQVEPSVSEAQGDGHGLVSTVHEDGFVRG